MTVEDPKADLLAYLQEARDVVIAKLDGLSEYDVRRPLTPTGTNLLGLVKHLGLVEIAYFSVPFGRPVGRPHPWFSGDEIEDNVTMWAAATESREDVLAGYRSAWTQVDAVVEELPLDTVGRVPWWGDGGAQVTLHRVLVHVIGETHRHAGHADIVRELIDGSVGNQGVGDDLPQRDETWWRDYRDRLEAAARQASAP
ncbi:DinB family protein [Blastococcus sp. CCUG 61487]|uniref:DinB family protein n=1 Tax=Blastococcus sp. CCUG 61487 TaxID=1840703 RepID=UPI0010BFEFB0|nr:DinB family protein [Blastococcus sp. CCUG 61487]TKJ33115.1 hypothetical protein A6V29_01565 [Blastococcus sp. CCUG 61487]